MVIPAPLKCNATKAHFAPVILQTNLQIEKSAGIPIFALPDDSISEVEKKQTPKASAAHSIRVII